MSGDLKEGDIVYAREIHQFAGEKRRGMLVLAVDGDTFSAELLHGDFGEPGVNRKVFHKRHQDWTRHG